MIQKKVFHILSLLFIASTTLFSASVGLTKIADVGGPITSGKSYFYTIKYSCDDIVSNCSPNVVITDELNDSLEFVKSYYPAGFTLSNSGNTLQWSIATLPAGSTGEIRVKVKAKSGSIANGTVIKNVASSTINSTNTVTSNTANVTINAAPDWSLHKSELNYDEFHTDTYADADKNVSYSIKLCPESVVGNLDLENVSLVDTFSSAVIGVEDADGGVVDLGANTITWPAFNATVSGGCITKTVKLDYNNTQIGAVSITNDVDITATPLGKTANSLSLHDDIGTGPLDGFVFNPVGRLNINKTAEVVENNNYNWIRDDLLNQVYTINYKLEASSTGNIALLDVNVTDEINTSVINVYSLNPGSKSARVFYKTAALTSWTEHGIIPANTTITSINGGGAIADITEVLFSYGDVAVGFSSTATISAKTTNTEGGAQSLPLNFSLNNCADINDLNNTNVAAFPSTKHSCAPVDVRNNFSRPDVIKTVDIAEAGIDEVLTYTLDFVNSTEGTGPVNNPIIVDVMPEGFDFVNGSVTLDTTNASTIVNGDVSFTDMNLLDVDSDGKLKHVLHWNVTGELKRGEKITVTYQSIVRNVAGTSNKINYAYIGIPNPPNDDGTLNSNTPPFACAVDSNGEIKTGDVTEETNSLAILDLSDGVDDATNALNITKMCIGSRGTNVIDISYMASEKLVKGALDTAWSKYPAYGKTYHGGMAEYELSITNTGNVAVDNIEILDILPYIGDTGIIDTQPRLSAWQASLVEPLVVPNATVSYSLLKDPCRADYMGSDHAGCEKPYWTTTPFKDITQARSIKIDFDSGFTLQPDENVSLRFSIVVPVNAPANSIAWNSFGYLGQRVDDNTKLIPSEPIKVGISAEQSPTLSTNDYGNFVWLDKNHDGRQDPNEPGINGVKVNLHTSGGGIYATTYTATSYDGHMGRYNFGKLPSAEYYASFVLPDGYVLTARSVGTDSGDSDVVSSAILDRDNNASTLETSATRIFHGNESDASWDMGIYPDATHGAVGDYVWFDNNRDGLQNDNNDSANVVVLLRDNTGSLIDSTTTTSKGRYLFYKDIDPTKEYDVLFVTHDEYGLTYEHEGADASIDSDANNTKATPIFTLDASNSYANFDALTENRVNLSVDGGLVLGASVGNFIFYDKNHNGIKNGGENGIAGVVVTLTRKLDNVVVDTQVTASDGLYLFDFLIPGDYKVSFDWSGVDISDDASHPYLLTATNGSGNNRNNGVSTGASSAIIDNITLTGLEEDLTRDIGLYRKASLGNKVWIDYNGNGTQDVNANEVGVSGVKVNLYENGADTTLVATTNASGEYLFDNLNPSNYSVKFDASTLPPDYVFTTRANNSASPDVSDSDADRVTGMTRQTTLTSNEDDMSWDAGIYIPASIGDYIWYDTNADGIQNGSESGLSGLNIYLYQSSNTNTSIASTTSGANGVYSFGDLKPDSYTLGFDTTGYLVSLLNIGSDTADNDITSNTNGNGYNLSASETLVSGEDNITIDGAVFEYASLGDKVWLDTNLNGIQDNGEVGVAGVKVYLLDNTGTRTGAEIDTNTSGEYLFENLRPGTYAVEFNLSTLPLYHEPTLLNQGSDIAKDSDADSSTSSKTSSILLESNEDNRSLDLGIYELASLGDRAWYDTNADGIQDAGEMGLANVHVKLFKSDNSLVAEMDTNSSGEYLFEGLYPNDYYVEFNTSLLGNYKVSPKNATSDTTLDSNIDALTFKTEVVTLTKSESNTTLDAGFYETATVGDKVWLDYNANGIQDNTLEESGIENVRATLYMGVTQIAQMDTNISGEYLFKDLTPSTLYHIEFTNLPSLHVITEKGLGTTATDSDANTSTAKTEVFTLIAAQDDRSWDMGLYIPASLGDLIWNDTNANGIQDNGEIGVDGVTVNLLNSSGGFLETTTTLNDGSYIFTNLMPNTYKVEFNTVLGYAFTLENIGSDDLIDSDVDEGTGLTQLYTLTSGENNLSIDAGIHQLSSIGDYVFIDENDNGIQDINDTPLNNVRVYLLDKDGVEITSMLTDLNGSYLFEDLVDANYSLKIDIPPYMIMTTLESGNDTSLDSDANATGETHIYELGRNEHIKSVDFGLMRDPSIQINASSSCIKDAPYVDYSIALFGFRDPTSRSVKIEWLNANGGVIQTQNNMAQSNRLLWTGTQVDANGRGSAWPGWKYENNQWIQVNDGKRDGVVLRISVSTAEGINLAKTFTRSSFRALNAVVNSTVALTYPPATSACAADAFASLGDRVWFDTNKDGIQDNNESGVSGISVNLLSDTNSVISTTFTNMYGYYEFENLIPDNYRVEFVLSSEYNVTLQSVGNDALDSDIDSITFQSDVVSLDAGERDFSIDAGIYYADSTLVPPAPPIITTLGLCSGDNDCDGIPNDEEPGDRDNDGIPDYNDIDPQGFFYDEVTGEIIPGGSMDVNCTNGATAVPLTQVSSNGAYSWNVSGIGSDTICEIRITTPPQYELSTLCTELGQYDVPASPPNQVFLGQGADANGKNISGFDANSYCTDNPFYLTFRFEPGDANIFDNNIPLKKKNTTAGPLSNTAKAILILLFALSGLYMMRRKAQSL